MLHALKARAVIKQIAEHNDGTEDGTAHATDVYFHPTSLSPLLQTTQTKPAKRTSLPAKQPRNPACRTRRACTPSEWQVNEAFELFEPQRTRDTAVRAFWFRV
jgi:hypothetical protein